jgi:hypothetical protein
MPRWSKDHHSLMRSVRHALQDVGQNLAVAIPDVAGVDAVDELAEGLDAIRLNRALERPRRLPRLMRLLERR